MRIEISESPVTPPGRGRKPTVDYSIFATGAVLRLYGNDPIKVRQKLSSIVTGAKAAGYRVRSHLLITKTGYVGCVTRKGAK